MEGNKEIRWEKRSQISKPIMIKVPHSCNARIGRADILQEQGKSPRTCAISFEPSTRLNNNTHNSIYLYLHHIPKCGVGEHKDLIREFPLYAHILPSSKTSYSMHIIARVTAYYDVSSVCVCIHP